MFHLKREEAITILKEIIKQNLVQTSMVRLDESEKDHFALKLNYLDADLCELRAFLADKSLILFVDDRNGVCTIYRP